MLQIWAFQILRRLQKVGMCPVWKRRYLPKVSEVPVCLLGALLQTGSATPMGKNSSTFLSWYLPQLVTLSAGNFLSWPFATLLFRRSEVRLDKEMSKKFGSFCQSRNIVLPVRKSEFCRTKILLRCARILDHHTAYLVDYPAILLFCDW